MKQENNESTVAGDTFRLKKHFVRFSQVLMRRKFKKNNNPQKNYSNLEHNIVIILFFFTWILWHEASEIIDSIEERCK